MAKFCGNCGTELENNAKVCGKCGMPFNGAERHSFQRKIDDPQKKLKRKKRIRIIAIIMLFVIIIGAAGRIFINNTGKRGLVNKVMRHCIKYDMDGLVSLSSDMYFYDDREYIYKHYENVVGQEMDMLETLLGSNCRWSYSIKGIYVVSERRKSELLKDIDEMYPNYETALLKKICIAEVSIVAKKGAGGATRDLKLTICKEGKKWRLLDISR